MQVSLDGMVRNICNVLEHPKVQDHEQYSALFAYELKEMVGNLKQIRDRKAEGEAVIDEFFALYV